MKNLIASAIVAINLFAQAAHAGEIVIGIQKITNATELNIESITPGFLHETPDFATLSVNHQAKQLTLQFVKMVNNCPAHTMCFVGPMSKLIREIKLPVVQDEEGNFDGVIVAKKDLRRVDGDFKAVTVNYVTAADGGPTFARVSLEVEGSGFTIDGKIHNFNVEMSGYLDIIE